MRVLDKFTWRAAAIATAERYRALIEAGRDPVDWDRMAADRLRRGRKAGV
jgi:hypothetical protein